MPLLIGNVMHEELDIYYRTMKANEKTGESWISDSQERIAEFYARMRSGAGTLRLDFGTGESLAQAEAVNRGMIAGYVRRYDDQDRKEWKIIHCEDKFETPINDRWIATGKLDLIVEQTIKGKKCRVIVDHKTAARIDGAYIARVEIDSQLQKYMNATSDIGLGCDYGTYNIIAKPAIRQKKGESFDTFLRRIEDEYEDIQKYFHRETVKPSRGLLELTRLEDDLMTREIESCRSTGIWYRNDRACFDYNSACPYLQLCVKSKPPELVQIKSLYRVRDHVHEELQGGEVDAIIGRS